MSKTNNLHDFLKDLADTIRQKTGVSESLNPQQFSDKIKQIQGSGSSEEESVAEYYYEVLPDISADAIDIMASAIPSPEFILANLNIPELPSAIESSTLVWLFSGDFGVALEHLKYFRFKDVETYIIMYNSSNPDGLVVPANTGDLESRVLHYLRHNISIEEERIQEFMKELPTYFKKITKEEYWQALKDLNS